MELPAIPPVRRLNAPHNVRSRTLTEPSAVIGGRAAFVLARVLEGSLRGRLSLRALLVDIGVGERDREVALEAVLALREAGELWHRSFPQRGNAETRGNDGAAEWSVMSSGTFIGSTQAAAIAGNSPRRMRQLAAAGDIPAERTARGWRFEREDVVGFRDSREAGR